MNQLRYYFPPDRRTEETQEVDVCIYGGSSAGVAAALQAKRHGLTAAIIEPGAHLGGLSAGGLGMTDIGNKQAIGGIAREFYQRVGQKYGVEEEWRFEPHVAEAVFEEFAAESGAVVRRKEFLESVSLDGTTLRALTTHGGLTVRAKMFIDASYEGDLLAAAKVSHTVGRESNATYGETLNGAQVRHIHQFDHPVSPYVIADDPASGLLPGIEESTYDQGEGDRRVQAYNFRLCLTREAGNHLPFAKPAGYDDRWYELLARYFAAGWKDVFRKFDAIRGEKTDTNNHGAVSTDFIGQNFEFPEGCQETRERIFQAHVTYQQGLMWFLANDPRVPKAIREEMSSWGLCRDEFQTTAGWPHQLYVREARRMVSDYVMTEHECRGQRQAEDAIALAAYTMDSHNCRRFVQDGLVRNEGDVQEHGFPPYPISYRSIVPKRGECGNLLVPVCLSASHIAYGSIRMEPVFMVLGQSAASAAFVALRDRKAVQEVRSDELTPVLQEGGQMLANGLQMSDPQAG